MKEHDAWDKVDGCKLAGGLFSPKKKKKTGGRIKVRDEMGIQWCEFSKIDCYFL